MKPEQWQCQQKAAASIAYSIHPCKVETIEDALNG
jgi:hypothetical protein